MKRYVREPHSAWVRRRLSSGELATSRLSEVEVASALDRRARDETLTAVDCARALAALHADLERMYLVEILPEITAAACDLLRRHPLRAGDSLQLASYLALREHVQSPIALVAFDARLVAAARHEEATLLLPST